MNKMLLKTLLEVIEQNYCCVSFDCQQWSIPDPISKCMTEANVQTPDVKSDKQKESDNELVISFLTLRNLIGISGMLLPIVLTLFTPRDEQDKVMEHSISEYYYTKNGDLFVVLLSVIGVFLLTYKGYDRFWERVLTLVAGFCGIGIAFFPTATSMGNSLSIHKVRQEVPEFFGLVQWHFIFATLFFISLALTSLIYFRKTNVNDLKSIDEGKKKQKAKRNIVYKICGWTMLISIALMIPYFIIDPPSLRNMPVIFALETVAVEAFGISWITKGQTLWPDGEHYMKKGLRRVKQKIEQST